MARPEGRRSYTEIAHDLLIGRTDAHVLMAMSPQQPTELAGALIDAAIAGDTRLTLYFADLDGRFAFLQPDHARAIDEGMLRLVPLAGGIAPAWHDRVDHFPNALWDLDRMLADGRIPLDLVIAEMSGRTTDAEFGFGSMIGYTASALASDAPAVAVLRSNGVVCDDAPKISKDRFAAVLTAPTRAEPAPPAARSSEAQRLIGHQIAALVPDGATLQLGIGSLAEAILTALSDKRDLGIHSGIVSPGIGPLLRCGAITGKRKSLDPGRVVATGLLGQAGSAADLLAAALSLRPISDTHAPWRLAAQESLWTINSALDVDLSGQVNAEYIQGRRLVSGGGQSDFVRAGHLSKAGGSVIALPSCTGKGESRIVAALPAGQRATTASQDVDFVVTEFGCADLRGRTMRERAVALVAIAHPQHRKTLQAAAEQTPRA